MRYVCLIYFDAQQVFNGSPEGLFEQGKASYQRALDLARQPAERRFLQGRLELLGADNGG